MLYLKVILSHLWLLWTQSWNPMDRDGEIRAREFSRRNHCEWIWQPCLLHLVSQGLIWMMHFLLFFCVLLDNYFPLHSQWQVSRVELLKVTQGANGSAYSFTVYDRKRIQQGVLLPSSIRVVAVHLLAWTRSHWHLHGTPQNKGVQNGISFAVKIFLLPVI